MKTHPNQMPVNTSSEQASKLHGVLKLLIARSQRQKFVFQFTLMTLLGWVMGGIASIFIEKTLLRSLPSNVLQVHLLSSAVFAVIFAAAQAIALRHYLSVWLWIFATSAGWLAANSVSGAWINHISSIATSLNKTLSFREMVFFGALSTIAYILSGIWLGFLQWLVLRRYTTGAWWWSFLPSISYCSVSILVWLFSQVQFLIPEPNRPEILYLSGQLFTAIILGVIPAIGFCRLKIKFQRSK